MKLFDKHNYFGKDSLLPSQSSELILENTTLTADSATYITSVISGSNLEFCQFQKDVVNAQRQISYLLLIEEPRIEKQGLFLFQKKVGDFVVSFQLILEQVEKFAQIPNKESIFDKHIIRLSKEQLNEYLKKVKSILDNPNFLLWCAEQKFDAKIDPEVYSVIGLLQKLNHLGEEYLSEATDTDPNKRKRVFFKLIDKIKTEHRISEVERPEERPEFYPLAAYNTEQLLKLFDTLDEYVLEHFGIEIVEKPRKSVDKKTRKAFEPKNLLRKLTKLGIQVSVLGVLGIGSLFLAAKNQTSRVFVKNFIASHGGERGLILHDVVNAVLDQFENGGTGPGDFLSYLQVGDHQKYQDYLFQHRVESEYLDLVLNELDNLQTTEITEENAQKLGIEPSYISAGMFQLFEGRVKQDNPVDSFFNELLSHSDMFESNYNYEYAYGFIYEVFNTTSLGFEEKVKFAVTICFDLNIRLSSYNIMRESEKNNQNINDWLYPKYTELFSLLETKKFQFEEVYDFLLFLRRYEKSFILEEDTQLSDIREDNPVEYLLDIFEQKFKYSKKGLVERRLIRNLFWTVFYSSRKIDAEISNEYILQYLISVAINADMSVSHSDSNQYSSIAFNNIVVKEKLIDLLRNGEYKKVIESCIAIAKLIEDNNIGIVFSDFESMSEALSSRELDVTRNLIANENGETVGFYLEIDTNGVTIADYPKDSSFMERENGDSYISPMIVEAITTDIDKHEYELKNMSPLFINENGEYISYFNGDYDSSEINKSMWLFSNSGVEFVSDYRDTLGDSEEKIIQSLRDRNINIAYSPTNPIYTIGDQEKEIDESDYLTNSRYYNTAFVLLDNHEILLLFFDTSDFRSANELFDLIQNLEEKTGQKVLEISPHDTVATSNIHIDDLDFSFKDFRTNNPDKISKRQFFVFNLKN